MRAVPRRGTGRASVALVALATALGCGDVPSVLGESHRLEIAPGAWAEAELAMTAGAAVEVDFDSGDVDLGWDVHAHEAGVPIILDEGVASVRVIEFEAPETRLYWVMWTNASDTPALLDVGFRFHGSAALTAWYP